ncbi:MAG: ribonuclease P protein component [Bacteroidales bacterium]
MLTFKKKERLCHFNSIDKLFAEGHSFFIFPLKIVWMDFETGSDSPAQLLISVPKRNFKHAVDRNLIKRQIREAYRHQKSILYDYLETKGRKCALAIVFTGKNKVPYAQLEGIINLSLQRLTREYEAFTG